MTRCRDNGRSTKLVVASVLHWDLFFAVAVAAVVTIVLVTRDLNPQWVWLTPVSGGCLVILGTAWRQRAALRNSLSDSHYGELLRIADQDESEVRRPYTLTILIAAIAAALAATSAVVVEVVSSNVASYVVLGISSFFGSWSFFGLVTLIRLSDLHERQTAELQAKAEEVRSFQDLSTPSGTSGSQSETNDQGGPSEANC